MGVGGMIDSHDFFHSEAQKEAGRVINLKDEEIYALQDRVSELELQLNIQKMQTASWKQKWFEENQLRKRKHSFIDWLTGYVG